MSGNQRVFVRGHITALTPVSVTYPSVHPKKFGGKPVPSFLPRFGAGVPVVLGDKTGWDKDKWDAFFLGTPFLQASTLRGALRRAACDAVLDMCGGAKFSVDELYLLLAGFDPMTAKKKEQGPKKPGNSSQSKGEEENADSGDDGGDDDGADEADNGKKEDPISSKAALLARKRNPVLALFGCWGLSADLATLGMMPLDAQGSIISGKTATIFHHVCRTDDMETERMVETVIPETVASLEQVCELVEVRQIVGGWESFPQGQSLQFCMELGPRAHDASLGLLGLALERFAQEPYIGSHRAAGHGRIAGSWTMTVGRASLGPVSISEDGQFDCPDEMKRAMDDFRADVAAGKYDFHSTPRYCEIELNPRLAEKLDKIGKLAKQNGMEK